MAKIYTSEKYYGRKGFYAMCGGGQIETGGAIHILLIIWTPTIIFSALHWAARQVGV